MKQDVTTARGIGRASLSGNNRKAGKEQYYTPSDEARRLVGLTVELVPSFSKRIAIDPSAGTGSFYNALKSSRPLFTLGYDIDPKCEGVIEADFLSDPLPDGLRGAVAVTNPPFGRNSSLSVPFFNTLAPHCDYIGFVVPKSWRKWTLQARLDRSFHLIHDEDLSLIYTDENGVALSDGSGGLKTVFQLWERRDVLRPVIHVPDVGLFEKTTPLHADLALRIFGRGCGEVFEEFPREPNTTLMFLKSLHPDAALALRSANLKQFYTSVAHVESLSWAEINFAVHEWMKARNK